MASTLPLRGLQASITWPLPIARIWPEEWRQLFRAEGGDDSKRGLPRSTVTRRLAEAPLGLLLRYPQYVADHGPGSAMLKNLRPSFSV